MIDTHCHLDACEPPEADLVERARAAGVTRLGTVGTDEPSIERALAAAHSHDEVFAIVGRHPHETEGFGDADLETVERAAGDPWARAIGETGLDYYRDYAPRDDQRRAFETQLELAARAGLPVVSDLTQCTATGASMVKPQPRTRTTPPLTEWVTTGFFRNREAL